MKDKLEITIRIAELPPMAMSIKAEDEEIVRRAEYNINQLWRRWSAAYHTQKSSHEILGMVAFQFAKLFEILNHQADRVNSLLDEIDADFDKMLLNIGAANPAGSDTTQR